jgi:hypothetical protein
MRVFKTFAEAQVFTAQLVEAGVSFTTKIVTFRKRLRKPMEIQVKMYGV